MSIAPFFVVDILMFYVLDPDITRENSRIFLLYNPPLLITCGPNGNADTNVITKSNLDHFYWKILTKINY